MVDEMRIFLTFLALAGIGLHFTLAWRVYVHRDEIPLYRLLVAYAVVSMGVLSVSAFWRLHDNFLTRPLNIGDLTALVPILGLLTVGVYGAMTVGRRIGEIETLRRIDKVTQNVTYLDVRKLA